MDHVSSWLADEPPEAEHLHRMREHPLSASDQGRFLGRNRSRRRADACGCLLDLCFRLQIRTDDARIVGKLTPS
jgi:hypothetical protein